MSTCVVAFILVVAMATTTSCTQQQLEMARFAVSQVRNWAWDSVRKTGKKAGPTVKANVNQQHGAKEQHGVNQQHGGNLNSWSPIFQADYVVARDGSGTYKTINEALDALRKEGDKRPPRVIIYVKSGKYNERVEIESSMTNITFVGDGIDRTIVNGSENHADGTDTSKSATFGISAGGFWARDMTFMNTAGPYKEQAVALRVDSERSVFYRCSFMGYQDTLYVKTGRQFYRDCQIHGTVDFIFGDATAVFQNCDIFVRRPMDGQQNMITAQGRRNPTDKTGISIQGSRIRPSPELLPVKHLFKSYLGRPWKEYSRTVIMKTDIDGIIDPEGWREWNESKLGLGTCYYAEYLNTGDGAPTRVKWPGFHVLNSSQEAENFTVSKFIQGETWIPETGVPFWPGL